MQTILFRELIAEPADYPKGEEVRAKRLYWAEKFGVELKYIGFGTVPVQGSVDRHFIIYVESANVEDTPANRRRLAEIGHVDEDDIGMRKDQLDEV